MVTASFSMLTLLPVLILLTSTLSTNGISLMMAPTATMVSLSLFIMPAGAVPFFLHAVQRVAADCAAFALWENEDFAFDALPLQFMTFFDDDACVGVYSAVETRLA